MGPCTLRVDLSRILDEQMKTCDADPATNVRPVRVVVSCFFIACCFKLGVERQACEVGGMPIEARIRVHTETMIPAAQAAQRSDVGRGIRNVLDEHQTWRRRASFHGEP